MKRIGLISIFMSFIFSVSVFAASPSDVGIILLHGKGAKPELKKYEKLDGKLSAEGYSVVVPRMPWSGHKGKADYNGSLSDAFVSIEKEVRNFRDQGKTTVVLVGHSMGTAGALAYAKHRGGIDGVIGVAPGHFPGSDSFHKDFVFFDVKKAKQMVEEGKATKSLKVEDYNSGSRRFKMTVVAEDYLSMFDPEGPMSVDDNLKGLGETPFLWVAPTHDPVTSKKSSKYFGMAPKNPKSKLVKIDAEHKNAPPKAFGEIHKWISEL